MYQNVYVNSVNPENGLITVGCASRACENCHSSLFCNNKNQTFEVRNPDSLEIREGDFIRIYLPPGKTILASAMLFVLPLVFFPVFYLIAPFDNVFIKAFIGIGGGALGFLCSYFYFRKKKLEMMPTAVSLEKNPQEELAEKLEKVAEDSGLKKGSGND